MQAEGNGRSGGFGVGVIGGRTGGFAVKVGGNIVATSIENLRGKSSEQRLCVFCAVNHVGRTLCLRADDALIEAFVVWKIAVFSYFRLESGLSGLAEILELLPEVGPGLAQIMADVNRPVIDCFFILDVERSCNRCDHLAVLEIRQEVRWKAKYNQCLGSWIAIAILPERIEAADGSWQAIRRAIQGD